jgi:hypothetical protein
MEVNCGTTIELYKSNKPDFTKRIIAFDIILQSALTTQ